MLSFKLKDTDCFVRTETNSGDGIILVVRENISGKIIDSYKFPACIEIICFEFSIYNKNGFFVFFFFFFLRYTSTLTERWILLQWIKTGMTKFNNTRDSFLVIDDFNMTPENKNMIDVLNIFYFEELIKEPTFFKSAIPSFIVLILY